MAELQTRAPTGRVAFPLVLVEGEDKAGKTYALAELSKSERVGRTFILDLGDGTLDEYASLGPFELLVHDGTWRSMIDQLAAAAAVPSDPARPNVIGVDSGTQVWQLLKSWADGRARNSRKNRQKLQEDPDAEVETTMNLWNDAKDRWAEMLRILKEFPGIGVLTGVGREVSKVIDGQPVAGQTEWSIDVEKTTTGWVSAWVRIKRPHAAKLIGVRSLTVEVPANGLALPDSGMLDHLVFEVLGAGRDFGPSTAIQGDVGVPIIEAKKRVFQRIKGAQPSLNDEETKAEAGRLWAERGLPNGEGEVSQQALTALLLDIAEGRTQEPPPEPPATTGGPTPDDPAPTPPEGNTETQEPPAEEAGEAEPVVKFQDGSTLDWEGRGSIAVGEFIDLLASMKGTDLDRLCSRWNLPKTGAVDDRRERIMDHFGLSIAPSEPDVDIPEGWMKSTCYCGEPIIYEKGNISSTIRHLKDELDQDHQADESF